MQILNVAYEYLWGIAYNGEIYIKYSYSINI